MNTLTPPRLRSMRGRPSDWIERMISAPNMRSYQRAVSSASGLRRWMWSYTNFAIAPFPPQVSAGGNSRLIAARRRPLSAAAERRGGPPQRGGNCAALQVWLGLSAIHAYCAQFIGKASATRQQQMADSQAVGMRAGVARGIPDSVESRASWLAATLAIGILSISYGAPLAVVVGLKPIAASLARVGTGTGGIVMGWIADRIGVRRIVMFGAVMTALGLVVSAGGTVPAL